MWAITGGGITRRGRSIGNVTCGCIGRLRRGGRRIGGDRLGARPARGLDRRRVHDRRHQRGRGHSLIGPVPDRDLNPVGQAVVRDRNQIDLMAVRDPNRVDPTRVSARSRAGLTVARGLTAARVPTNVRRPIRATISRRTARAECVSVHGSRN